MSPTVYGHRRGPRAVAVVALTASLALGATVWHNRSAAEDPAAPVPQTKENVQDLNFAKSLSKAFRAAANATLPSVVTITSEVREHRVSNNNNGRPMPRGENPFKGTPFEDFFNDHDMPFNAPRGPKTGVGAGVIIDKSGLVLTNNHVVEGATEVTVRLSDGREFKGTDIKTDPQSDLAVVRIKDAENLHAAVLGNSDDIDIGDWVIAVGNPFNQEMTVSAGIISGKGRTLASGHRTQYLQTDAAINPGNSGGPLVDLSGEVVGINTAIASNSGGFQGVGFAIPVNQAKWVVDQLVHNGSVKRAYLGVQVGELAGDLAEQFGVNRHEGVLVNSVVPDSPAEKAGLREGDIITEFGGKHVGTPGQLQALVERTALDKKVDLRVKRDGKSMDIAVGVATLPDEIHNEVRDVRGSSGPRDNASFASKEFGFEVADITSAAAEQLGMEGVEGVVITDVAPNGLAAENGLAEGMVIKKVGQTYVKSVEEFEQALAKRDASQGVMLLVRTSQGNRFVVLKN